MSYIHAGKSFSENECKTPHSIGHYRRGWKIFGTAHCDCMAEMGESCTHVASLLFAIESGVCIRNSMTVTQKRHTGSCLLV